ncbi:MAG: 5-formyltetrahydrofolate cyclo-ligase [Spirochaetia bacterium]|jgi:5-formyltetrahydrofolate cyclo-ligase|nr:5-formyltetrahydrofolate cyclo-ligase [Spirochaetia bacterium]
MDNETAARRKQRLRREIKKILAGMGVADRAGKSGQIRRAISLSPLWEKASLVAAFLPLPGEPDLRPLLGQALAEGKKICLPRVEGEDIVFHLARDLGKDFAAGAWGISEPAAGLPRARAADFGGEGVLFLVPGLAFDRQWRRLGRGRGFYDRFFRGLAAGGIRPPAFGVAFSCQIIEAVPVDGNDFPLCGLVSEHGMEQEENRGRR